MLRGDFEPGQRLAQGELAATLGVSRTPVREALRRLTGEGLVEFRTNYGFSTTAIRVGGMLDRMEVRSCIEPHIAQLAATHRTQAQLEEMQAAISDEKNAQSAQAAADASRTFHLALARATSNEEFVRIIDGLWIVDVGRWALARRHESRKWQVTDAREHQAVAVAVAASQGGEARRLMQEHLENALVWWKPASERAETSVTS